ncbi:hypothetical protein EJP617_11610 [Erwinia sp. Ejp617]|nr:hypothetical protein EJP617_11610 [Erwinia sp. Ejp617]
MGKVVLSLVGSGCFSRGFFMHYRIVINLKKARHAVNTACRAFRVNSGFVSPAG